MVAFMTSRYVCALRRTIKLDMLREHKPPPIQRIRISDFVLPDPKRDPDRHQNCITWSLSHALFLQKISSKSVHKFASNPTDRQTNRPHQKHNLRRKLAEVMTEVCLVAEVDSSLGLLLALAGSAVSGVGSC